LYTHKSGVVEDTVFDLDNLGIISFAFKMGQLE